MKVNICFLQQFSVSNPHETCISPLGFPRKPGQPWNLPPTQKISLPPQPKKQKTSRNNSAPVKQIPYYIKYQGQRTCSLSLCMNFGKSWAYHTPWCASHPTWNSPLIAWGHSCGTSAVSPKKTAPEFRDRSHLRVDVGRKLMGTWRQEVIFLLCGRWMNFHHQHDLKGSHKVMPTGTSRLDERQHLLKFVGLCGKMVKWKTVKLPNCSIWFLISLIHSSLSYCISTNTVVMLRIVMIIVVEYQFSTR